jgi:hypothetical protein
VTSRRSAAYALLWLVGACEPGRGLGSRVEYAVSQAVPYPFVPDVDAVVTDGLAGSCVSHAGPMTYSEARSQRWAVGTGLEVQVWWPDRNDCGAGTLSQPDCPRTLADFSSIAPDAWDTELRGTGAAVTVISTVALRPGEGGFRVAVQGSSFSPDFLLTAAEPSALMFERTSGPFFADRIPGAIDRIDVAAGQDAAFVVTLRGSDGAQICGQVPAVLRTDGDPVFTIDRIAAADAVNLPYHILARTTPGVGRVVFDSAGLHGVLTIAVQ